MTSLAVAQTEIEITGVQEFLGKEIPVIEGGFGEGQKVILAKDLAELHEVEVKYINKLINNNIDNFSNDDLINLLSSSEELRNFAKENGLIGSNRTQDVFLLSERGYIKLVSMMDNSNDKKWEVMSKLINEYFAMRKVIKEEQTSNINNLSPQLQLLINMELEQKKLKQQINEANYNALSAKAEVKTIKEVVSLDTTSWRSETQTLIAKIARNQGDLGLIKDFRNESYELLNKRFAVNLEARLTNKRRRMAEEGVSKSKRDKLNNLDVISEDKKLIEGYVIIVKDMAIKYGI